jgi:hypothetical protein
MHCYTYELCATLLASRYLLQPPPPPAPRATDDLTA